MKKGTIFLGLTIIIMSLKLYSQKQNIDLIIHNAVVYTVDKDFSKATAIAVDDGKIVAVGNDKSLFDNFDANSLVDAGGKYIYPGFNDGLMPGGFRVNGCLAEAGIKTIGRIKSFLTMSVLIVFFRTEQ